MHQESNQLAISFDLHKPEFTCLARKTDPQTSIDAARVVQRLGITELHKRLILDALRTYGPMTAKERGIHVKFDPAPNGYWVIVDRVTMPNQAAGLKVEP